MRCAPLFLLLPIACAGPELAPAPFECEGSAFQSIAAEFAINCAHAERAVRLALSAIAAHTRLGGIGPALHRSALHIRKDPYWWDGKLVWGEAGFRVVIVDRDLRSLAHEMLHEYAQEKFEEAAEAAWAGNAVPPDAAELEKDGRHYRWAERGYFAASDAYDAALGAPPWVLGNAR